MPLILDENLPEVITDVVNDSVRVHGTDPDIPMTVALATVSAALGRGLQLQGMDSRRTSANIYAVASADSASGKSSVTSPFVQPFFEYEATQLEAFGHDTLPSLKAEKHILEADRVRVLKDKDASTQDRIQRVREIEKRLAEIERESQPPRLIAEDVTTQKLAMLMQRDEQMFIYSPDARDVLLNITGRHNNGDADDGVFLKGFSNEPCTVDRVGRAPVALSRPCLAMLLLITPDEVDRIFESDRLLAGGFLPRCLLVSSKTKPRLIPKDTPTPDKDVWRRWDALITDLVATYRHAQSPAIIRADDAANEGWRTYHNDILQGVYGTPNTFSKRHAELSKRLSLILHAAKHGARACHHEIEAQTALAANNLMQDWLGEERQAMLDRGQSAKDAAYHERITSILDRHNGQVTVRDLHNQHGIRGKRMEALKQFVDRSNDFQWGKSDNKTGRPGVILTWADSNEGGLYEL